MKLWILKPTTLGEEELSWDCTWGLIVRAKTAAKARQLAAKSCGDEGEEFWLNVRLSNCNELKPEGGEGIILVDHHAG